MTRSTTLQIALIPNPPECSRVSVMPLCTHGSGHVSGTGPGIRSADRWGSGGATRCTLVAPTQRGPGSTGPQCPVSWHNGSSPSSTTVVHRPLRVGATYYGQISGTGPGTMRFARATTHPRSSGFRMTGAMLDPFAAFRAGSGAALAFRPLPHLIVTPNAVRDPPAPQRRSLHGAASGRVRTHDAHNANVERR